MRPARRELFAVPAQETVDFLGNSVSGDAVIPAKATVDKLK